MVRKNKNLEFNISSNTSEYGSVRSNFYTGDKGSASINIRVKYGKDYLNLTEIDMTPKLDLFHSDGSIWMDEELYIPVLDTGLIQYNIPENVIKHKGSVKAKLFLVKDEKSIHVANFTFDIKDSGIEGAVEKEISVNLVDDAVKKIMNEQPELFKGEKGDKGDTGPQGVQGEQGPKGDTLLAPPKIYTRDEYNQLATKDSNTLYFISEV